MVRMEIKTDRQAGRQKDRQADREAGRQQTDIQRIEMKE